MQNLRPLMPVRAIRLPRLWMVCCAGWLGRSLPGWRRIAGATGSDMVATVDYNSSGGMRTYEGRTPLME